MYKLRKAAVLLLCAALILTSAPAVLAAEQSGQCGDGLTWSLVDGILTISGTGDMWDFKSTATPWGTMRSGIKEIIVEDGVTSIGDYAFRYSNTFAGGPKPLDTVTRAVIPASVKRIGHHAFYGRSGLESIVIPDGVTCIEDYTFWDCKSLKTAKVPDSVQSMGEYAFGNCSSLESIHIPDGVSEIPYRAFYGCTSLSDAVIPESVTNIGGAAFFDCQSLKTINIPDGVTSIGSGAFGETGYYNTSKNWSSSILYYGKFLLDSKSGIYGSRTVKAGTVIIADGAFYDRENLKEIILPDSVEYIGASAFGVCTKLSNINIPASARLGENVFIRCTGMKSFTVDENNPYYAATDGALFSRDMTKLIYYPAASSRKEYAVPETVEKLGDYAFYEAATLRSAALPERLKEIGQYCFAGCKRLETINLSGIEVIESHALYGCKALTILNLMSAKTIGSYAFFDCTGLQEITFFDQLESIGNRAFGNCAGLDGKLVIPASVTEIGDSAFYQGRDDNGNSIYLSIRVYNHSEGLHYAIRNRFPYELLKPRILRAEARRAGDGTTVSVESEDIFDQNLLIAAAYDENGGFLTAARVEDGAASLPVAGAAEVKIFVWSGQAMIPLCSAVQAELM
ncbi:MAG: leucine-rich repeat domain-containing protein [Oscillospiraceae bacterium]|nr:leucine-rich repeat domain-containing protein [Oscillospiraceae bacterium]